MTRKCRGLINIGYSNYKSLLVTSDEIYSYSLETLMKGVMPVCLTGRDYTYPVLGLTLSITIEKAT